MDSHNTTALENYCLVLMAIEDNLAEHQHLKGELKTILERIRRYNVGDEEGDSDDDFEFEDDPEKAQDALTAMMMKEQKRESLKVKQKETETMKKRKSMQESLLKQEIFARKELQHKSQMLDNMLLRRVGKPPPSPRNGRSGSLPGDSHSLSDLSIDHEPQTKTEMWQRPSASHLTAPSSSSLASPSPSPGGDDSNRTTCTSIYEEQVFTRMNTKKRTSLNLDPVLCIYDSEEEEEDSYAESWIESASVSQSYSDFSEGDSEIEGEEIEYIKPKE